MKRLDSLPLELRDAFDRGFAVPPPAPKPPELSLLIIELNEGVRVALRLDRLFGVHLHRKIVRLPASPSELLGIAGVRGSVLPVWDLSLLLGMQRAGRRCRWIAECQLDEPVGFAFESLVSQIEVPEPSLRPEQGPGGLFKSVVQVEGHPVGVLDVASLIESLPVAQSRSVQYQQDPGINSGAQVPSPTPQSTRVDHLPGTSQPGDRGSE